MGASVEYLTAGTYRATAGTATTVYTVPTGKKLSAMRVRIGCVNTTGQYIRFFASGGTYSRSFPIIATANMATTAALTGAGYAYSAPCDIAAASVVRLLPMVSSKSVRYLLHGILEDV